jgi:hypothetical protein
MEFHLPEYTEKEFTDIVVRLGYTRHKLNKEVSEEVARVVWNEMSTKDVRDALQLMRLVRNLDEVEKTARTIMKYKPKILNPSLTVRSDQ